MTSTARIATVSCSLSMASLIRAGLDLRYEVTGAGPALLLPAFNLDFLVSNLSCPLFAFWGEDDEEIARGGGVRLLAAGLDCRGLKHASFPGHDHEGMLAHINEAVPSVLVWFDGLSR
jgi:hypothetical protein